MTRAEGKLFIVSGPSGAGKSTVLKTMMERLPNAYFSISVTTREMRPGEVDGVHYHFISREAFAELEARGELLESARYVGNDYGTPLGPIREKLKAGCHVFLDIEVQGAKQVLAKMKTAVSIFIAPPGVSALEERLRRRGTDSEEWIRRRVEAARLEYAQASLYDYIVINDSIETAVGELLAIVTAEGCRAENRVHLL